MDNKMRFKLTFQDAIMEWEFSDPRQIKQIILQLEPILGDPNVFDDEDNIRERLTALVDDFINTLGPLAALMGISEDELRKLGKRAVEDKIKKQNEEEDRDEEPNETNHWVVGPQVEDWDLVDTADRERITKDVGGAIEQLAFCGHRIVTSPDGIEWIQKMGGEFICEYCAADQMKNKSPDEAVARLLPGIRERMEELHGKERTAEYVEYARRSIANFKDD